MLLVFGNTYAFHQPFVIHSNCYYHCQYFFYDYEYLLWLWHIIMTIYRKCITLYISPYTPACWQLCSCLLYSSSIMYVIDIWQSCYSSLRGCGVHLFNRLIASGSESKSCVLRSLCTLPSLCLDLATASVRFAASLCPFQAFGVSEAKSAVDHDCQGVFALTKIHPCLASFHIVWAWFPRC